MDQNDLTFVIPTYRLRDVGETVEQYDEHLWRNGHSVRIMVFDDSSPANQEKYFPLLEQTRTHNDVYYVGPREKEQFLGYLNHRLHDARLEGLVRNLFRPSYGGNRNCTARSCKHPGRGARLQPAIGCGRAAVRSARIPMRAARAKAAEPARSMLYCACHERFEPHCLG